MTDALIGASGFVGGAILRQRPFDALYRSTNIDTIRGHRFDCIVCCGAPAEKWRANHDPEADRAQLARLTDALETVTVDQFILISTVDVYPNPVNVDETTSVDATAGTPYGRHRYTLERFCSDRFNAVIVRLPALFGRGLKKNAVYDLLNDRPLSVPGNSQFQFYDVDRTWSDVERVMHEGLRLANITSEPVTMAEVARRAFGRELATSSDSAPVYDVRSRHAALVGGANGYWFDAETTLAQMQRFVAIARPAQ